MRNLSKLTLLMIVGALMGCSENNKPITPMSDGSGQYDLTGEILVDLKDNISDNDIKELSGIAHTKFHENNRVAHQRRFEIGKVNPREESEILARLKQDKRVEHAEPIIEYKALFTPNDPLLEKDQWGMHRVGAESAWNMSCARNVIVSVIDTGVSCSLSDFTETHCITGYSAVNDSDDAQDDHGHGSFCAATIAETTNNAFGASGLAYCATILPVKVLDAMGSGSNETVAEGIIWATDNGANIISLSLGGPSPSEVVKAAVNYAHDHDVTIVAAAGNNSRDVGWPAAFPNVIAVSALDQKDNLAHFSSRGPEIAISSPGVDIWQQTIGEKNDGFQKMSGTSMSTPFVAAEAALIYSMGITKPDSIREKIQSSADPKDNKEHFGAGIARADRAITSTLLWHTLTRAFALFGILFFLGKKVNLSSAKSFGTYLGVALTGFGLVPLFFTGLLPHMGSFRWVGELLSRPMGEWDLIMGMNHSYLLFANCIPAAVATLFLLNTRLRNWSVGLCLGSAALCAQVAWSNDVSFWAGSFMMRAWMVASAMVCIWLAQRALTEKQSV